MAPMLRRILAACLLMAVAALAVPSATAINDPHVPCYPDFYGGTVCVIGESGPCFTLVSYNPDPRHPQYPVHVGRLYCRNADGTVTPMTPCLPLYLELDPYCWTEYPDG